MPISLDDLQTPLTAAQIRETQLDAAAAANFPVDSWQDEGAARGYLEMSSAAAAEATARVAELSKMAHTQTSKGEFLDVTVKSAYNATRNPAVATVFDVDIVNDGTTNHGVQAAGALLLKSSNGQIFANTTAVNVAASATISAEFKAQLAGADGNIPAQTLTQVTPLAGVRAVFDGVISTTGNDAEADAQYLTRAIAQYGALRVEKVSLGLESIVRGAVPSIHSVRVNGSNPRGAGTVDVYLAALNATAGVSDVSTAQDAINLAFFGQAGADPRVKAIAAPTDTLAVTATVYVVGTTEIAASGSVASALTDFINNIPVGGYDLSPGPSNVVRRDQIDNAIKNAGNVVSVDLSLPAADVSVGTGVKLLEGSHSITIVVVGTTA